MFNGYDMPTMTDEARPEELEGGDYYTVEEAAKVLDRTPGRIRQMLRAGELQGVPPAETEGRGWRVHKWSVHALRDEMAERSSSETTQRLSEAAQGERDLLARVVDLQRQLGRLEGRLELTAQTESTIREQLEHERRRAQEERERAEHERERAEVLRRELEELRGRGFWRRLFGR